MKILSNHMLVISIINKFPLDFPYDISLSLEYFLTASLEVSKGFSSECLLLKIGWEKSPLYFQMIVSFIYPLLIVFLIFSYKLLFKK